jgi:hypothetical protein
VSIDVRDHEIACVAIMLPVEWFVCGQDHCF